MFSLGVNISSSGPGLYRVKFQIILPRNQFLLTHILCPAKSFKLFLSNFVGHQGQFENKTITKTKKNWVKETLVKNSKHRQGTRLELGGRENNHWPSSLSRRKITTRFPLEFTHTNAKQTPPMQPSTRDRYSLCLKR